MPNGWNLQPQGSGRNCQVGRLVDFLETLYQRMATAQVVHRELCVRGVIMEAVDIVCLIGDGKWIVNAFCLRRCFHDADGMAELFEQAEHARTIAGQVVGVVQNDFQATAATSEQKGAQQIVALQ